MARKRTKTQELKSKLKRQIREMEKRGYSIPSDVKQSIENANYSRLSSYQRNRYKRLYRESTFTDIETGEEIGGFKAKLRRKSNIKKSRTQDYGEQYEILYYDPVSERAFDPETGEIFDAESEFYGRTGYTQSDVMSASERDNVIIDNVVEDFIQMLSQDIPDYYQTSNGRRKHVNPWAKKTMEEAQTSLLNLVYNEINGGRKEELAERLERNASDISLLITKLYSDSDSGQINASRARLSYIIAGRNLSVQELIDLEAEQILSDGYEEV